MDFFSVVNLRHSWGKLQTVLFNKSHFRAPSSVTQKLSIRSKIIWIVTRQVLLIFLRVLELTAQHGLFHSNIHSARGILNTCCDLTSVRLRLPQLSSDCLRFHSPMLFPLEPPDELLYFLMQSRASLADHCKNINRRMADDLIFLAI